MSQIDLPPGGDSRFAEKYIYQFIELINQDRLTAIHTDLSKFDPSNLQDHYRMELQDYFVEVSHSKHPSSGADSFIMLFTNLQQVREGCTEKVILAYMHLDQNQFQRFRSTVEQQTHRKKKMEEERRLTEALSQVDQVLTEMSGPVLPQTQALPAKLENSLAVSN